MSVEYVFYCKENIKTHHSRTTQVCVTVYVKKTKKGLLKWKMHSNVGKSRSVPRWDDVFIYTLRILLLTIHVQYMDQPFTYRLCA